MDTGNGDSGSGEEKKNRQQETMRSNVHGEEMQHSDGKRAKINSILLRLGAGNGHAVAHAPQLDQVLDFSSHTARLFLTHCSKSQPAACLAL